MKEYIKMFESADAADNYAIADIPFITSVAPSSGYPLIDYIQNLVCNQENKKIVVNEQGNISIVDAGPVIPSDEIWYTSSDENVVTPYQASSLPEIDTNTYSDGKGVIKFKTNVTNIGDMAFYQCVYLTSLTIGNSVTSIGDYAFESCHSLNSVTISNSVTSIGDYAFYDCFYLKSVTIGNSVTRIGDRAFGSCSSLTSVTIPDSVTSIGDYAFLNCSSLTSINVASDNSNYCSVDGILFNKDKTTLIQYLGGKQGAYTIPNSVTSIEKAAFLGFESLTSIEIPDSVTSIGAGAFRGCESLPSVTIPNSVTSIGDNAFNGCTGLTSLTIGNSVTSIGVSAFEGCTGLTTVTIPDSVISIGTNAFTNCRNLTSLTIGNSVTSIETSAFTGCTMLPVINNIRYADTYLVEVTSKTLSTYTIKEGTKWIEESAFKDCTNSTSITIPNSVIDIKKEAFGTVSAKILFSKLYSTYTNKIFSIPISLTEATYTYNVEFNISEIPSSYNISSMLPKQTDDSVKVTLTYNIYTDYAPCKDQALALATTKTIVNVYHIDGTPWE